MTAPTRALDLTLPGDVLGGALLEGWQGPRIRVPAGKITGQQCGHGHGLLYLLPSGDRLCLDCFPGRFPEGLALALPGVRDHIVRVAGEGVRCAECWGTGHSDACRFGCNGTGYTRQPYDLSAFRDHPMGDLTPAESAALLFACVMRIEAGMGAVAGPPQRPVRTANSLEIAGTVGGKSYWWRDDGMWRWGGYSNQAGDGTAETACEAIHGHVLAAGYALRTTTGLLLPMPEGPREVTL